MINPIFDQNIFKILTLFSLAPGSRFTRKEIKEKTQLNNVPLDASLSKLIKTPILKRQGSYYYMDFENEERGKIMQIIASQYKQLKEIPLDVYFILVDLVYRLSNAKEVDAYLFGSYSKLVYKEDSDVDIAVLTTKKFNKNQLEKENGRLKKIYNKNVEIHYFDKFSFYKNKKDPLVREIIKNGVRII